MAWVVRVRGASDDKRLVFQCFVKCMQQQQQ
jgi:hypothetical protein